jgi:hypothetical protein
MDLHDLTFTGIDALPAGGAFAYAAHFIGKNLDFLSAAVALQPEQA